MRSSSPADDIPHSASRTASPASHQDHLSLFADNDDDFYSQSEDNQDLAPDTEIQHVSETQSEISTDDMGFLNLLKFLGFFWPTCSLGKLKSFWEGTGQDLPLSWRSGRLPKEHFSASIKAPLDYGS